MEAFNLDTLADQLTERLTHAIQGASALPLDKQLWDATQCADYLRQGRRTFQDKTSKQLDFPTPIRVPTTGSSKALPVWKASEVIEWAESWKL